MLILKINEECVYCGNDEFTLMKKDYELINFNSVLDIYKCNECEGIKVK